MDKKTIIAGFLSSVFISGCGTQNSYMPPVQTNYPQYQQQAVQNNSINYNNPTLQQNTINQNLSNNQQINTDNTSPDKNQGIQNTEGITVINESNQEVSADSSVSLSGTKSKEAYIHLYPSYGNDSEVYVRGRVTKDPENAASDENASGFSNFFKNIGLISQSEIKNINVDIEFNGKVFPATTDKEGYFKVTLSDFGEVKAGYNTVSASIGSGQKYYSASFSNKISVQTKNDNSYGIITDIDDTIQVSNVTNKLIGAKTLLFNNYKTQKKIAGTSELYQALDKNNDGAIDGDIYYVSGSPIQISARIENFLSYNSFPQGSIDLKIMGLGTNYDSPTEQIKYKVGKIRTILNTYPDKNFICFGDSGEKDPEIYKQISEEFPGRVIGIYINNVTKDSKGSERYAGMLLTNSTAESADDLFSKGYINSSDLQVIKNSLN